MEAMQGGEDDDGADTIIIQPKYRLDERLGVDREYDPPSDALYIGLGWDEDKKTKRKHYRLFYNDELEEVEEVFPEKSPFNSYDIMRGQSRGVTKTVGVFKSGTKKDESGSLSTLKKVGTFKGIIEIESQEAKEVY